MKNFYTFLFFISFSVLTYAQSSSVLCGATNNRNIQFTKGIEPRHNTGTIEVVTWNVLKFQRDNSVRDMLSIANASDILFLQEAVHSGNFQNKFELGAGLDWTFYKSFCQFNRSATGVQTGTRFPQLEVKTVVAPGYEPILRTPKVSGLSIIEINSVKILLVNIHGLNFNQGEEFEKHIDQISMIIGQFSGPVIWAGDFNTWNETRMTYLKNTVDSLGLVFLMPKNDNRSEKLDHIIVRGFKAKSIEVLDTYQTSDHFPVRAELEFLQ
ncbi:MAG: endonuclease/exonuclease/phosphatase family protein [Pseudobdellovibrio sp.]